MENLFILFLIVNLLAFVLAGFDKYLAVNKRFRIPERTLLLSAFCGGSVGLLLAMLLLRHKVRKPSFVITFLVIFLLQIVLAVAGLSDKL